MVVIVISPISILFFIISFIVLYDRPFKLTNSYYGDKDATDFNYYNNHQGIRTKKIVNGKTTEYYLDGDEVIYETSGSDTIRYTYDLDGSIISMNLNGTEYFYIKDLQGNITGIIDKNGNQIVEYEYDAYGNILHIYDNSGINLGHINPYRYREYRYDDETGWYYLDSRYYSPQWGRFINADGQINGGILGNNLYAYCENNPVMNIDPTGSNPGVLALGLGFSLGPVGWTIIGVVAVVSVVAVAVYVSENSTPGGFYSPPIDSTSGGYSSPPIDTTSGGFSTTSPGFTHEVFNGEGISTGYMFSEGAGNTKLDSKIKAKGLPTEGDIVFQPKGNDVRYNKEKAGFVDNMGNVWQKGPYHGDPNLDFTFEWDVQLSPKGLNTYGEYLKQGKTYINVRPDGKISH